MCFLLSAAACTSDKKQPEKTSLENSESVAKEIKESADRNNAPNADLNIDETPDSDLDFDVPSSKNKGNEDISNLKGVQISTENALKLIEEKYGANGSRDKNTGNEKSYVYENIQEVDGNTYYNYRYSWIVYEDDAANHISQLGNIFVATDGSSVMYAEKTEDGWNLYNPDSEVSKIFIMEDENGKEAAGTLILNNDHTFSFTYDPLSSYMPYGNYTFTDSFLECRTMDGKQTYIFDVIDDNTLSFNQEKSTEIKNTSSGYAVPKHKSLFHLQDD